MKYMLAVIMSIVSTAVCAQIRIDGRRVLYDSESNTMLATIPETDFNKSKRYTVELEEGWSNLKINGTTVNSSYYFNSIKAGKTYPITIRNKDQHIITSNITFTFLPIMLIEGDFGYEYQKGRVSLYSPDGEVNDTLSATLKWRGGSTNTDEKHKRNYKIKFDDDYQFFGLRKDNNWILDAGQNDLFRLRNRIATEIWNEMARKPYYADKEPDALSGVRGRVVELFLNKEYRGIYCLTEAMDRKEMKLKKVDKKTGEIRGCLYKSISYSSSLMWNLPDTYDNNSETWDAFEVKYPEIDDTENGETDWSTLWNAINFVAKSSDEEFRSHVAEYFDIPVLIDYYIFLYLLNCHDNIGKNMYWAIYDKTSDQRLTPAVWDLDLTVGSKFLDEYIENATGPWSPDYTLSVNLKLYHRLKNLNVGDFKTEVINRYYELRKDILSTDQLTKKYIDYFDQLALSGAASREESLWSEDSDIRGQVMNFENEIYYITYWLTRHLQYLDEHLFKNNGNSEITSIHTYQKDSISQPIFNLKGLKVNNPQKGIYIKDGKKYVIH
jgi:hypothetical protein